LNALLLTSSKERAAMFTKRFVLGSLGGAMALLSVTSSWAADLAEIRQRGEIRHIGIRYANFVTGAGDGMDVDLMQGFAERIGVNYKLVYSDFYSVIRDLLGKDVVRKNGDVTLVGDYPIKGDVISTGFTVLPWREAILLYSEPTLPSQVLLVAPAESELQPIRDGADLAADIASTRNAIGSKSVLVMERTCLDPTNYGLVNVGLDLKSYNKSANLNEMVPAMLNKEAELTLLDVPDAILDLRKWAGRIKIIGPISEQQTLATAFPKDAPALRDEFNAYLSDLKASGAYDRLVDKYYPGIRRFFPEYFAKTN
jgi:ABC-type amino acid transport substrate-binding protein